jgi:hypothetical protein
MRKKASFLIGLFLVISYWISIRPAGLQRGYIEDYCTFEMSRQIMGDQLKETGLPRFHTQHFAHPSGISTAFMPQSIEQTWLGGYVWNWNRNFPFFWVYFGVSLLLTFLGVGWIAQRMGLSSSSAWAISTLVTVFHIPRHFVIWYHSEHLYLHWVYLGFFLDAWIWQRFYRENRWSLKLECWRGFFAIANLGTAGYFWGPALLEWAIVRLCMLGTAWIRRFHGRSIQIDDRLKSTLAPLLLCVVWIGIELLWFLPLFREAKSLGTIAQGLSYHAPLSLLVRPLWFDWVLQGAEKIIPSIHGHWLSFQNPETKVTIGWLFWIPAFLGLRALKKKNSGPGALAGLPFMILLAIAVWYIGIRAHWFHHFLQKLIPFLVFFRVASRWGLFLPPILGVLILLSWPELSRWFRTKWNLRSKKFKILFSIFFGLSVLEGSWLLTPVLMMEPLSQPMVGFLNAIKNSPGTLVLDIPFCLNAGNGVCSYQCPSYPYSTAGACFRQWHEKDVFGIYASRLVEKQCKTYDAAPFYSWIVAWREQRCFNEEDWKGFCDYLDQNSQLSAILIYPDLWKAAQQPECLQQIHRHLGVPVAHSSFFGNADRGGHGKDLLQVERYAPKCHSR